MPTRATYTPACSRNRLRFLQHLCRKRTADSRAVEEESKPNVIMIVPGDSGRSNVVSQAVIKYLLLGQGGRDLCNATLDFSDAELEEVALRVSEDGIAMWAPQEVATRLEAHFAAWRNRVDYRVREEEEDEVDEVESFKIRAFLDMVKQQERVGMPLTQGWYVVESLLFCGGRRSLPYSLHRSRSAKKPAPPEAYDAFEIESWPLVQAYALEDFKMGGFFSQNHKVVNISPQLEAAFTHVDAHYIKANVYGDALQGLAVHWGSVLEVSVCLWGRVHVR